jgi:hypothetical protein
MVFSGKALSPIKHNQRGHHEARGKDIMVDGRAQRSLFPHLNEWLPVPFTEQEKRLISIPEIVEPPDSPERRGGHW